MVPRDWKRLKEHLAHYFGTAETLEESLLSAGVKKVWALKRCAGTFACLTAWPRCLQGRVA
jgi:hypothetical protein